MTGKELLDEFERRIVVYLADPSAGIGPGEGHTLANQVRDLSSAIAALIDAGANVCLCDVDGKCATCEARARCEEEMKK